MKHILWAIALLVAVVVSFQLGKESAKPSTSRAVARLVAPGAFTELAAGLMEDAKSLVTAGRLDVCLADTERLEDANKGLAEALGTMEHRREEALLSARESKEELRKSYETTKALSEKLYQTDCEAWANTNVCPNLRGMLRSERDTGSRGD